MAIPKPLVDQIADGQVVLFLGSGASIGALHCQKMKPPTGPQLAEMIAQKFLDPALHGGTLAEVSELAVSETDLLTVQSFVASIFTDFYPADFHQRIASFQWPAIATTNYDLILERAYGCCMERMQTLVPFTSNRDRVEPKLRSRDSVVYLKLHGCITQTSDPSLPLILTPDQYVTHKQGRSLLFERLVQYAYNYPILFVGHSLADLDIRSILLEISQLKEAKPRSYLIMPGAPDAVVRMWEAKRVTCLDFTFEGFISELDRCIDQPRRALAAVTPKTEHPVLDKCALAPGTKPSQSLMTLLTRDATYVHRAMPTPQANPKAFYRGYFTDWSPIVSDLDVRRRLTDDIMSEVFLATGPDESDACEFYVVKGHAGSGKTVLLRRLAWDASVEFGKLCLYVNESCQPEYEPLHELHRLTQQRLFLFFDPVNAYVDTIGNLLDRARSDGIPLTIVGAERQNEWNIHCENSLGGAVSDTYEVKYLTEREIDGLISTLERHKSLGHLEALSPEQRKDAFAKVAGRQLLVALHEATLGKAFTDIVVDEYNSIRSPQAQSLYLTVCVMHRLGVRTRAGLLSRVHGIPFSAFKERLFKPLEFIVFAREDRLVQDYVYESRHPHISEIVFERVLINAQERFDEYVRLLRCLDVGYQPDREGMEGLVKAKGLLELFRDPEMVRQIFSIARERDPGDAFLLQQEAIFEMKSPGGSLDRAARLLQEARSLAPYSGAIAHSLSELSLQRAGTAASDIEKRTFRDEAKKAALALASRTRCTVHPHHTLIKIAIEEIGDLAGADEAAFQRKVKEVEGLIARAHQLFPENDFILTAEADLCSLLSRSDKALDALAKAHKENTRSPFIAIRLSKMYELGGRVDAAVSVIKACVESNPGDKGANSWLARLLDEHNKGTSSEVKHYLRRSFTDGDANYMSQFAYARLLYLDGQFDDARRYFGSLRKARVDPRVSKQPRAWVLSSGIRVRASGVVDWLEHSYCFVLRDGMQDRLYCHRDFSDEGVWDALSVGRRVTFEMAFNFHGPVATAPKPESAETGPSAGVH